MAEGADIDLAAHERGYTRFLSIARIGAIACACVAALVIFLITR